MDCATNRVVRQVLHLHRLIDDALPGEGGITVDKYWHDLLSVLEVVRVVLVGSHFAHDDWVDAFQMRRVGEHFNCEVLAHVVFGEAGTQVVFDIARVSHVLILFVHDWCHTLKLSEDLTQRFVNNISQHV